MLFFRKGNMLSIFPPGVYEGSIFSLMNLFFFPIDIMLDEK